MPLPLPVAKSTKTLLRPFKRFLAPFPQRMGLFYAPKSLQHQRKLAVTNRQTSLPKPINFFIKHTKLSKFIFYIYIDYLTKLFKVFMFF